MRVLIAIALIVSCFTLCVAAGSSSTSRRSMQDVGVGTVALAPSLHVLHLA